MNAEPTKPLVWIEADTDESGTIVIGKFHTPAEARAVLDALLANGADRDLEVVDHRPVVTVEDCRPIQGCRHTSPLDLIDAILRGTYVPAMQDAIRAESLLRYEYGRVKITA